MFGKMYENRAVLLSSYHLYLPFFESIWAWLLVRLKTTIRVYTRCCFNPYIFEKYDMEPGVSFNDVYHHSVQRPGAGDVC